MRRRTFLKYSPALAALPSIVSGESLATSSVEKPLKVALLGCGWYGKMDLIRLMQIEPVEVVGLCDVDSSMLGEAANRVGKRLNGNSSPNLYTDYNNLLQNEAPDVVLIASPDHQHAPMAIAALEAGADLYLQKPVSVDVLEGEAVLATARRLGRTVQIGTQRRSTPHLLDMKERIIDPGLLGRVAHVEMCCYYHMRFRGELAEKPLPNPLSFDYDRWTGPAPLLPYVGLPHRRWRSRTEYGNGIVGDMCVHMLDTARWLLGLGWPQSIHSVGGIRRSGAGWANTSDTQTATFSYPALDCVWQHRSWGNPVDPDYPWALFLYGENGTLKMDTHKWSFHPNKKGRLTSEVARLTPEQMTGKARIETDRYPEDATEKDIELHVASATRAHLGELLLARREKRRPNADVEEGHISTASCILANISRDLGGRPLRYDPENKVVIDDPEATALLRRPYRAGYEHPWKG